MDLKECTKCKCVKSLSDFQFYKSRNKYNTACKACHYLQIKDWRKRNRKRYNAIAKKSYEKSPEYNKEWQSKQMFNLTDTYIKGVISRNLNIKTKDIPQSAIDLKRVIIQAKRLIRNEC
jgi:hypothetical protein